MDSNHLTLITKQTAAMSPIAICKEIPTFVASMEPSMPAKCGLIAVIVHSKVSSNAIDRRQGSAQYRKALSYHLQTHVRATAFPNITGTTKRNSSSLHPVRRSVHHHRGATNIRRPLCPIPAYMVDSRRAPDSERCLWR